MNAQDILFITMIANVLLGSTVLPQLVAIVISLQWKDSYKRWAALVISILFATAQWYLTTVVTGQGAWEGIAITGPILFGSATVAYNKYWKGKLGTLEEIDFFGKLIGPKNE